MSEKTEGNDMEWLAQLEARVGEATERLHTLRQENRRLTARVEELEEQLEAAQAQGEDAPENSWTEEREEIRRRVTHLTQTLEDLIADEGEV